MIFSSNCEVCRCIHREEVFEYLHRNIQFTELFVAIRKSEHRFLVLRKELQNLVVPFRGFLKLVQAFKFGCRLKQGCGPFFVRIGRNGRLSKCDDVTAARKYENHYEWQNVTM